MVSDQELAEAVENLLLELTQNDPEADFGLEDIVDELGTKLQLNLYDKIGFINERIVRFRGSDPPECQYALQQQPQLQYTHPTQLPPHLEDFNIYNPNTLTQQTPTPPPPPHQQQQLQPQTQPPQATIVEPNVQTASNASAMQGESTPARTKKSKRRAENPKRGAEREGFARIHSVSPALQGIIDFPALPKTEILQRLYSYIRKHNLLEPSNNQNIIFNEALRTVFGTDRTTFSKMNELLKEHVEPLEPSKKSSKAKRLKVNVESATGSTERTPPPVLISEALAKFLSIEEREMSQSDAFKRVMEYIKVHSLEDPSNSIVIKCDTELPELLGCERFSVLDMFEILARRHFFRG